MGDSLKEHCERTKRRYGVTGESVHRWMDELAKILGPTHRKVRHDPHQEIPLYLVEEYGVDLARNIMLDHWTFDKESTLNKLNNKNRTTSRKPKQTTIHEEELHRKIEKLEKEKLDLKNTIETELGKLVQDYKDQSSQDRLNPFIEARMFQHYLDGGLTQEQVVEKLGLKNRAYLTDRIVLLDLSKEAKEALTNEKYLYFGLKHFRPIAMLPEKDQMQVVSNILNTGGAVSTRQIEEMVRSIKDPQPEKKAPPSWKELLVMTQELDVRLQKLEMESGVFRGPDLLQ